MKTQFSPARVRADLVSQFYAEIETPSIGRLVRTLCRGFDRMILDESHRHRFTVNPLHFAHDETGEELEFGLMRRVGSAKSVLSEQEIAEGRTTHDRNKWVFHYAPELMEYLEVDPDLKREYDGFLRACQTLHQRARAYAHLLAQAFDAVPHRYPESMASKVAHAPAYTRLLRYDVVPSKVMDAGLHRDRSAFTVHHFSSHPGLVLFDRALQPVAGSETDVRKALIFPGLKFWMATRGEYGTGTIHGVRDLRRDEAVPGAQTSRYAMVSFVHTKLSPGDLEFFASRKTELMIDPRIHRQVL